MTRLRALWRRLTGRWHRPAPRHAGPRKRDPFENTGQQGDSDG